MLFIKRLLLAAGLAEKPLFEYSIACISTTRPIYLVFENESDHPKYVIRKLGDDHELQAHRFHAYLYRLVGSLVPKPVGLFGYAGDNYDIQQGVKGSPWFQIKSKISTEAARACLEERLWQTLASFQSAIAADSDNNTWLRPHEELAQVYAQYKKTEQKPDAELEKLVELGVSELSGMPDCSAISQHGDFCLNNVIIDTSHITVIDFEDFAITKMPLYDHFTLALSLPSCSSEPHQAVKVFSEVQIVAAAKQLGIPKDAIEWHFLHHILLRLGPWSTGEKRSTYRTWLKQVLVNFTELQGFCTDIIKLKTVKLKGGTSAVRK